MKRLLILFLALFLSVLSACGASQTNNEGVWCVEDFALYDLNSELYNYPLNEQLRLNYYDDEDKNYQTMRGAKLYSPAKVALSKYDFTGFYCSGTCYPIFRSETDEEKEISQKYLEKYPNVNDAIKNTKELETYDMSLFISGVFAIKNNELVQLDLNEFGNPIGEDYYLYETYCIDFIIKNDEIISISLENEKPYTF